MKSRRNGLIVAMYIIAILIALTDCLWAAAIRLWGGPPDDWTFNIFLYGPLLTLPALYLSFHRNAYAPIVAAAASITAWSGLVLASCRAQHCSTWMVLTFLRDTVLYPLTLAPLIMAALLYFIARLRGEIEGT